MVRYPSQNAYLALVALGHLAVSRGGSFRGKWGYGQGQGVHSQCAMAAKAIYKALSEAVYKALSEAVYKALSVAVVQPGDRKQLGRPSHLGRHK